MVYKKQNMTAERSHGCDPDAIATKIECLL
jgi:hypothetical protein